MRLIIKLIFFIAFIVAVLTVNLYLLLSPKYVTWQYGRLSTEQKAVTADTPKALVIVDYLRNNTDRLPILTHKERSHLADVRNVFNLGFNAFKVAFLALLAASVYIIKTSGRRKFLRYLALCCAGGIAFLIALSSAMLLNFNWMFNQFHGLFFTGDSWLFGSDSLLIRLFPFQFWLRAGLHWASLTISELFLIGAGAVLFARR